MAADNQPIGNQWNFDKANRNPPALHMSFLKRIKHRRTIITKNVLALVKRRFADHFGQLDTFDFAVTRKQALKELHYFIKNFLPQFGAFQDAMLTNEPYLYHSRLSAYLNCGLLLPQEMVALAEAAYQKNKASLNSVEGFIRQILGWREYIRGIYWLNMPKYARLNYFFAKRPLPAFYWDAKTRMFCLSQAISQTRDNAYAHHIQRLMLTGNFALLAGLNPLAVCEWYLLVYADAYEWVELPNTLGMSLFADGGMVASKPYIASGKYIQRMSNYCNHCSYDPALTVGENACPFNALYWDFVARHGGKLKHHRQMAYTLATWLKMSESKQRLIREQTKKTLKKMMQNRL